MQNFILVVRTVFGGAWELFQTEVPGFTFTYADIITAGLLASAGFVLLRLIFGFAPAATSAVSRGSSRSTYKISDERKNDEK